MTREAFEAALDSGLLQVSTTMVRRWYNVRRNGRTRTWKRDGSRFEIPIKWGFRNTYLVTADDFYDGAVDRMFRITNGEPDGSPLAA